MSNLGDPQVSLTLDPKTIAQGFANDGQDTPAEGQVSSLTSTNNFINYCLTVPKLPNTNGEQIVTGSCNPTPMGVTPSIDLIPSCKFIRPQPFDVLFAGRTFTAELTIQNFQTGFVTNPVSTYLSAPQVLNSLGEIQGHASVVIETLDGLNQTTPLDPRKFIFFRTMAARAVGGVLKVNVTGGLPSGTYRLSTILRTSNFAPLLLPIEQRGSSNDVIYFTVTGEVPTGLVPAPSTDPFLDPKQPTSTTASGSNPTDTSIGQAPEVHHSSRAGIIAGVALGVSAAIILTAVLLFCRRRRRAAPLHDVTIRPFRPTWPRTSRLFGVPFLRPLANQKGKVPRTEAIPLSNISSSHNTYGISQESVVALREQAQATPVAMDESTYQIFQEFLAAREQGLLPSNMDVPPSYEEIARSVRSIRRPIPVSNSKGSR